MTIVPAQQTMVSLVSTSLRPGDLIELKAFLGDQTDQQTLGQLTNMVNLSGQSAWAAMVNDEPALIFGVFVGQPAHLGTAWGFGTDRAWRTIPKVSRFIRLGVIPELLAAGLRRVEVRVLADNKSSVSWLSKYMGATFETALPDYGVNGETFLQFAWTKQH